MSFPGLNGLIHHRHRGTRDATVEMPTVGHETALHSEETPIWVTHNSRTAVPRPASTIPVDVQSPKTSIKSGFHIGWFLAAVALSFVLYYVFENVYLITLDGSYGADRVPVSLLKNSDDNNTYDFPGFTDTPKKRSAYTKMLLKTDAVGLGKDLQGDTLDALARAQTKYSGPAEGQLQLGSITGGLVQGVENFLGLTMRILLLIPAAFLSFKLFWSRIRKDLVG
jgi:hypothetical protein